MFVDTNKDSIRVASSLESLRVHPLNKAEITATIKYDFKSKVMLKYARVSASLSSEYNEI
jgi:hypothetical protein